jgi:uncharacterized protein YndB with AHSA1/START domain
MAPFSSPLLNQGVSKRRYFDELSDSSQGEVRVFEPNSHLRITWQPQGWQRASLIQVRVMPAKTGTTISFHQEHLPGSAEREQRRTHFEAVLDKLDAMID